MKFLGKYIAMIMLVLCASGAAAQSSAKLHSGAQVSDRTLQAPTIQDPTYSQSNSILDRKISVHATPTVGDFRQQSTTTGSGIYTSTGVSSRAGLLGGASTGKNPFSTISGGSLTAVGAQSLDANVIRNGGSGSGLDLGDGNEDLQPGQLVPMGDGIVALIIMLLCYALFLLVRADARKDQELA